MDNEQVADFLRMAAHFLAMIPTEDLERHIRECETSVNRHESFAPILDVGVYMDNMRTGKLTDAKNQNAIGRALLEARKAIDTREG